MRLSLLALLFIACGDKEDPSTEADTDTDTDSDTDTDADTDTDTDTDTDADTDTDTDADTDTDGYTFPPPTQPCLNWHGIYTGQTMWNFTWTGPGRIGTRQMSVFEIDQATQSATLLITEDWTQDTGGINHSGDIYEYVQCNDDGLYITRRIVDATTTITLGGTGSTDVVDTEMIYDIPSLLRPNTMAVGDSWTSERMGTLMSAGAPDQSINETVVITVLEDNVSVMGTQGFTGYRLDNNSIVGTGFGVLEHPTIWRIDTFDPGLPFP